MELNIGSNIKRLRLSKGLTQEQLANLLSISTAAISKWEAKNTYPDITLLFPLAEIFGISVDELLGYDEAKAKTDIDFLLAEHLRLRVNGFYAQASERIAEARKKYPHDYRIMIKYMWDKAGGSFGNNADTLLENKDEFTQICNCILDGCTQDSLRAEAIEMKAKLLHAAGDTENALEILSQLPTGYAGIVKERLFSNNTPEHRYWKKRNCYGMIDDMAIKLGRIVRDDSSLSITEKIERIEAMAEAFAEMSQKKDLALFCIGEEALYGVLTNTLSAADAPIDVLIRLREKQFAAMKKVMHMTESDPSLKDAIVNTYKTDDMIGWEVARIRTSPHPFCAELRKHASYMEMLKKWKQ